MPEERIPPLGPEDPPVEVHQKTAPFPHWVTILLGVLSPSLALLSLFIASRGLTTSVTSLQTAQKALEVGHRAYLLVDLTGLQDSGHYVNEETGTWDYDGSVFTVTNLGNTPAYRIKFILSLPDGVSATPHPNDRPIGPRQKNSYTFDFKSKEGRRNVPQRETKVCATVEYQDAFGSTQRADDVCAQVRF